MFDFRDIELTDKLWIDELLAKSDFMGCEYSFANNVAWRRLSDSVISRYKDFYLISTQDDDNIYLTYPGGEGDILELINTFYKYCNDLGKGFVLSSVTTQNLEFLKENLIDKIDNIKSNPDYFDYIYNAEDLINLRGKKYHSKRNHISNFKKQPWEYKELTPDLFDDCIKFVTETYNKKSDTDDFSAVVEQFAINTFFNNFEYMNLKGGVLFQNDKIVGVTIGEQLNSNTLVVHIEKAASDVNGAYPTICNEFAKANAFDLKYINREEDLGIEGLRKSKRSYHPCFQLEKHAVIFKRN